MGGQEAVAATVCLFFATPTLATSVEETVRHVGVKKEWTPQEVFTLTVGGRLILTYQPKLSKLFVSNKVGICHDVQQTSGVLIPRHSSNTNEICISRIDFWCVCVCVRGVVSHYNTQAFTHPVTMHTQDTIPRKRRNLGENQEDRKSVV